MSHDMDLMAHTCVYVRAVCVCVWMSIQMKFLRMTMTYLYRALWNPIDFGHPHGPKGSAVCHGVVFRHISEGKVKVKVHTFDIAPLRSESPSQKRSVWHVFSRDFTVLPAHPHVRSSAIGMSHTCLCLPSRSWYSFTDPGGRKGWVDLGAK